MVTNICSMQIAYSQVVFCVDTLHSKSIFCKFYPSIQLTFSAYWFKKCLYFDQTLCYKVFSDIVRSVYPVIYHFIFRRNIFPKQEFYENNMILWYYQIRPKVVWKLHGVWIDGYDSQNKDKNITITKNKSLLFFPCSVS